MPAQKHELYQVFELYSELHTAEGLARIETKDQPKINREWTVAKAVGKKILEHRMLTSDSEKISPHKRRALLFMG